MSPTFDLSCVKGLSTELDGDPDRLDHVVSTFRRNVTVMIDSADNLARLRSGTNEIVSKAFTAAAKKAFEVESGIRGAANYYQQVANAVAGFSPVLRDEQAKAPGWLDQLHRAEARLAVAGSDYERARHYARNVDPAVQQQGKDLAAHAVSRHNAAAGDLNEARNALRAAAARVREANDDAAAKVRQSTDNAGLKDSFWDHLVKIGEAIVAGLAKVAAWVWENLDTILLVLTIVSFFIPGGAPILTVITAITRGISVLSKIKRAVTLAQKGWEIVQAGMNGDWGTAGRKVLAVGASYALGKITGKVVRKAARGTGKALFALNKDGSLTTTKTGRAINRVVTAIGPVIKNADGSSPKAFISRSIDRTTQVITNASGWVYKKGISMVTKPLVKAIEGEGSSQPATAGAS